MAHGSLTWLPKYQAVHARLFQNIQLNKVNQSSEIILFTTLRKHIF